MPLDGLPPGSALATGRGVFTDAYAMIPADAMRDIMASRLPHWEETRVWVLARPLSGFAETFSHYLLEIAPGGGSDRPEPDQGAEAGLYLAAGQVAVIIDGETHRMETGGFAYLPPDSDWTLRNWGAEPARLHWIRKAYEEVDGVEAPAPVFASERHTPPAPMPDTDGGWTATVFVDPADLRHDMAVTVVTLAAGAVSQFEETHVMEHGLYVLEGRAVYRLNGDWLEVQAGDFLWLRAFCPQACYASGPERFRYLLYNDVNRHTRLGSPWQA
ncbi:MAG: bifunctional allantoicase/(S)-ureidoglycine aminohydrolase [Pseudomonadota bacterium]